MSSPGYRTCMELSIGASPDGPALAYRTNRNLKVLTFDRFVARARQCLSACNLEGSQFAYHSIRRSGASHCYATRLPSESIKLIGNWSSTCYLQYIDNDFQSRVNIVSQMQKYVYFFSRNSTPYFYSFRCSWRICLQLVCSNSFM